MLLVCLRFESERAERYTATISNARLICDGSAQARVVQVRRTSASHKRRTGAGIRLTRSPAKPADRQPPAAGQPIQWINDRRLIVLARDQGRLTLDTSECQAK